MPPVPLLPPRNVVKAFEKLDWHVVRQRGNRQVARGTLRSLISRAGYTIEEFVDAAK